MLLSEQSVDPSDFHSKSVTPVAPFTKYLKLQIFVSSIRFVCKFHTVCMEVPYGLYGSSENLKFKMFSETGT